MTSFLAIENYSPILVLLLGTVTWMGLLGLGMMIQALFPFKLPSPWRQVVGVLLGVQILSLATQLLGMTNIAFRPVLIALWLIVVLGGSLGIYRWLAPLKSANYKPPQGWAYLPLAVIVVALLANLVVAIAPSSKIDELHYHMLVPSRIVADGAMHFYRQPWEGAIYPQMLFQIAAAPLHALGFPDAVNVISWGLSLILVWFGWYLISQRTNKATWNYIFLASLVVGMYPVVWYVTGGAHAWGDLATASVIVALLTRDSLIKKVTIPGFALICSVGILSAVASKVSLLPLGFILFTFAAIIVIQKTSHWRTRVQSIFWFLAPWLIFYLPILVWTFLQSGSPFGPLLSSFFPDSIYDVEAIKQDIHLNHLVNQYPWSYVVKTTILRYSPLIFIAVISFLANRSSRISDRLLFTSCLLLQSYLIFSFLPYDLRFLGGLLPGFVICFALQNQQILSKTIDKNRLIFGAATIFLLVPWLTIQIYYASQFIPIGLGIQQNSDFHAQYTAFFQDYLQLDNLLDKNAVLVPQGTRINSVYFPRNIYLDSQDIPEQKEVFLFQVSLYAQQSNPEPPQGFQLEKVIYRNDKAVVNTSRTPGSLPQIGNLKVVKLIRKDN